jgi:hypothetical protein
MKKLKLSREELISLTILAGYLLYYHMKLLTGIQHALADLLPAL